MPPKEKKPKTKKPAAPRRRRKRTITQITQLPRLPTGLNRDIPMGGSGGSSNLLASIAANRPYMPPATPIQTPDAFRVAQEQTRQAQVLEKVVEEQAIQKRGRRTDAEIAEQLGVSIEEYKADRAMRTRKSPATPLVQMPLSQMAGAETEPLEESTSQESFQSPPASIKKAARGKKKPVLGYEESVSPEPTAPPVIGMGATYAGGGPVRQQGLNISAAGRLKGSPPQAFEIGADTDTTVFMD